MVDVGGLGWLRVVGSLIGAMSQSVERAAPVIARAPRRIIAPQLGSISAARCRLDDQGTDTADRAVTAWVK